MADTADVPEPYVHDSGDEEAPDPESIKTELNSVVDRLVNPEEAGELDQSDHRSDQELRNERWERLQDIFEDLKSQASNRDSVYGLQIGYISGVGGHPLGIAIALRHSPGTIGTGRIPDEIIELTKSGQLRLVEDRLGSTAPVRVFGFALPNISTEKNEN